MLMFQSPSRGKLTLDQVFDELLNYISDCPKDQYKLIIGTDSHNLKKRSCFVTAIIVHRVGKGARYFFRRTNRDHISSLRQKIFYETSLSLEIASKMTGKLSKNKHKDLNLEIHLDVGENGETKELIREVVGMVFGSGFSPKIKPYSFGASKVADKYTK
ncbi:Ribonuclease H-like protein [Natranaerofaba carboxydovora]|nr:ribonuclease H-like YkuK family protein [Natranaerofaba carboxydovora]UMZ75251.1 Ribonuclease H-like protein [Natranaerofaba carboxydovora]